MEKSKNVQTKKFISWPLQMLLCLFGIWPGIPCGLFCKIIWLTIMSTCMVFQYTFLVIHVHSFDLTIYAYAVALTLAMSTKFIKIIIFWYNQRRFNEMWRMIEMKRVDWKLNSDYTSTVDSNGKTQVLRYLPNFIVAFNSISVIFNTSAIMWNGFHYDLASNATRPYAVVMHLPFDVNSKSVYLTVLILQFFYLLILSAGAATINSVLIILILYLGDEIDVICRRLTHMPQGADQCIGNVNTVKEIIKKHQSVITFSENIESLYTYIALILLVLNTLISCGLGFILVASAGTPNFFKIITKNFTFYCVINIETFVFCFAGEYVSAKSKKIGEAAYNSPWYQSKFHGHAVIFMIMRSQNRLTITMGKIMELSLERFSSIIKASASYMSVLLAMY